MMKRSKTFHERLRAVAARHTAVDGAAPPAVDTREILAHALYDFLRDKNNAITLVDVTELLSGWGLPQAENAAASLFRKVDSNDSGCISFEEFKCCMWFVTESIWDKGG